ncbi:hypothetical protein AB0K35_11225 [Micromonospora sp. NPDC053740]|uniref:hypothetical protein n=1 Tax=Micromonospora sp. NPDC053740 TaxID=3155173 RepID=UPI00341EE67B
MSGALEPRDFTETESIMAACVVVWQVAEVGMVGGGNNAAAGQQTTGKLLFISFIQVTYDCDRDQAVD